MYDLFLVLVGIIVGWQFPQPEWARVAQEVALRRSKEFALWAWKFMVALITKK
jgi:hypothetical protein